MPAHKQVATEPWPQVAGGAAEPRVCNCAGGGKLQGPPDTPRVDASENRPGVRLGCYARPQSKDSADRWFNPSKLQHALCPAMYSKAVG
eukprot:7342064-Prymnesium_polylepis.1